MATTVITDSGNDLSRAEAARLGIEVIPVWIMLGKDRMRDGVEIDRVTFFRRVAAGEIPTTEPPSEAEYRAAFARAVGMGNDVVAITLSSQISQSYANAVAAAKEFAGHVHVVDSVGAAGMEALLSIYAVELSKKGNSAAEIAKRVDPKGLKTAVYFAVPDLTPLGRSGRLPKAVVALGSMLNVSLVLKMNEQGAIGAAGQSFSFEKTCEIMVDAVLRTIGHSPDARIVFGHVQAEPAAMALMKTFEAKLGHSLAHQTLYETSLTIAAYQGPGSIGIFAIVP
jgi:DegV family protein with EDD domain